MAAVNLMEIGQAAGPQRDQRTVCLLVGWRMRARREEAGGRGWDGQLVVAFDQHRDAAVGRRRIGAGRHLAR